MGKPTASDLLAMSSITASSRTGDFIDGIIVGQDALIRTNQGKAFNRIMLIFTDGESKVEDVRDLEPIVEQMTTINNFALHIFLVGKVTESSSVVKKENSKLLRSLTENVKGYIQ